MDLDAKIEERKKKNTPFLTAFKHVCIELDMTQKDLCKALDIKPQRITEWKNGIKPVPEPVKYALVELSVQKNIGQISIDFLDGYTDIMLLANIPDNELAEIKLKRSNPDYDKLKAREKEKCEEVESMINASNGQPTPSSVFNASLAQQAESVEAFRIALAAKNEVIENLKVRNAELQQTIADKEIIIKAREARIVALERQLATIATSDIDRYPFVIGAAEDEHHEHKHI
jgi:transcriptional regulator with XRE-family HTH domain